MINPVPGKIVVRRYGGPDVLEFIAIPQIEPAAGQVKIAVIAAGVSYADLLLREGLHPENFLHRAPFTPGWDIVGVVDKVGAGVSLFQPGDTVVALPVMGGYAEEICLPERELVPVPAGVDPLQALCLVLNYTTAFQMLLRSAQVKRGDTLFLYGAGGGVGVAVLQLASLLGVRVFGAASLKKENIVRDQGGYFLDIETEDLESAFLEEYGGCDAVFDGIGGKHLHTAYRVINDQGRLVYYGLSGALQGGRPMPGGMLPFWFEWIKLMTGNLFTGRKRLILFSIQTRKRLQPAQFFVDLSRLLELLADGKINPLVDRCFPITQAAQAHQYMATQRGSGKVILTMQ